MKSKTSLSHWPSETLLAVSLMASMSNIGCSCQMPQHCVVHGKGIAYPMLMPPNQKVWGVWYRGVREILSCSADTPLACIHTWAVHKRVSRDFKVFLKVLLHVYQASGYFFQDWVRGGGQFYRRRGNLQVPKTSQKNSQKCTAFPIGVYGITKNLNML